MANSSIPSNLAAADAADKQELEDIRSLIETSDQQYIGSRRSLYEALGRIFDLTNTLVNDDRIEAFVRRQDHKWGKVALGNPFQPLTVLAFKKSKDAGAASKYAKVLLYAVAEKPEAVSFADWVESAGGIEELVALARGASADPLERYEETPDERYDRAVAALAEQSIGRLSSSAQVDLPSSYVRALVRQVDVRLEVGGIVPVAAEAVQSDIFALVPPEPPRARRKLQDKPLYEIFRLCDLASRWFPKSAFADPLDNTFLVDDGLSAEDYTLALQAVVKEQSAPNKVNVARYAPQTALRFRHSKGHWYAETVSTQPSFPVFQCRLTEALPGLDLRAVYVLTAAQVKRVANTFAETADWKIRLREPPSKQGYDAGSDGEIVFDRFAQNYAWRELAKPKAQRAEFPLSRAKLNAIGRWFEEFRSVSKAAKLGGLPTLMALRHEEGVSIVVPLLNPPDQGDDPVSPVRQKRQKSGTLPFAPCGSLESISDNLDDRFFKRQDLMTLVAITSDYGIDFKCRFLEYSEGIAALRASTEDWSIVIPMAISLSGHYAGVAQLLDQKSARPTSSDATSPQEAKS